MERERHGCSGRTNRWSWMKGGLSFTRCIVLVFSWWLWSPHVVTSRLPSRRSSSNPIVFTDSFDLRLAGLHLGSSRSRSFAIFIIWVQMAPHLNRYNTKFRNICSKGVLCVLVNNKQKSRKWNAWFICKWPWTKNSFRTLSSAYCGIDIKILYSDRLSDCPCVNLPHKWWHLAGNVSKMLMLNVTPSLKSSVWERTVS